MGEDFWEGSDGCSVVVFYAVVEVFPGDEAVVDFAGVVAWFAVAPAVAESFDVPATVFHLGHVFHFFVGEVVEDLRGSPSVSCTSNPAASRIATAYLACSWLAVLKVSLRSFQGPHVGWQAFRAAGNVDLVEALGHLLFDSVGRIPVAEG